MIKQDWNKRPKGCRRTVTGMHVPKDKVENYAITFYCSACGLMDDTNEFQEWLYGKLKKVDDKKRV